MPGSVLITGATGNQGGAVVNALLDNPDAKDYILLAVTRNTASESAKKLAAKSSQIRLIQGNLDDPTAILEAAKKEAGTVGGVFSVQTFMGSGASLESEERQGKALIDASIAAGVKHFIQTSVDRGGERTSDDNPTNVPHFISKHKIEQHLREKTANGAMDWTILRPVAFMDMLTPDMQGKIFATTWKANLGDKPLQLIATRDIGGMAAQAFTHPQQYKNRGVSLAGDELSFDQMNDIFKRKVGKDVPVTFGVVGSLVSFALGDIGKMFKWFKTDGYGTDVGKLREEYPPLMDFATWLQKDGKWNIVGK